MHVFGLTSPSRYLWVLINKYIPVFDLTSPTPTRCLWVLTSVHARVLFLVEMCVGTHQEIHARF